MDTWFTGNPWLWMIAAFLLGVLFFALLDLFVFRRRTNANVHELEEMLGRRDNQLHESQDTLDQARGELKAKGQELSAALAARAAAEKELDEVREQLTVVSNQLADTRAQRETHINVSELEQARGEIATLTAQLKQMENERGALQTEMEQVKAQHSSTLAQVAKLTVAAEADGILIRDLDMSKTMLTEQLAALQNELKTSQVSFAAAMAHKMELENELAEFKMEMGRMREQVLRLENEDGWLASQVAQLTAGALAASELINTLEGDKRALTAQVAQLQADLDGMTTGRALVEAELADLKLQLNKLDAVLGIAHKENANYEMQLAARVNEIDTTRAQLMQLREDNNALLGDLAKFTARAAAASNMVKGLDDEKRQLNAQLERLQRELAAAHAARVKAEARAMVLSNANAQEAIAAMPEPAAGMMASNGQFAPKNAGEASALLAADVLPAGE